MRSAIASMRTLPRAGVALACGAVLLVVIAALQVALAPPSAVRNGTARAPGQQHESRAAPQQEAGTAGPQSGWPSDATTGVPAGTRLTQYTGPAAITTAGLVLEGLSITGSIEIRAANVVIRNSVVKGQVSVDGVANSLTIVDSEIDAGSAAEVSVTGLCCQHYTATRVEIRGGTRSAYCSSSCTIEDSWVHSQVHSTTQHESGIRFEQHTTLRHNRIQCDAPEQAPDGGCSADITGYPDFAVVHHNTIDGNYLMPTSGSWCLYGGNSPGKQFSGQTHHMSITNNVFEPRPGTSDCGLFGNVDSFPLGDPNSVWSNNTLSTTGAQLAPN